MSFEPISRRTQPLEWYPEEFQQDAIAQINETKNKQLNFVQDAPLRQTNVEIASSLNPKPISSIPALKPPDANLEMDDIQGHLQKVETLAAKFERKYLEAQAVQRELREMDNERAQERIRELQAHQKALHQEFDDVWDGINEHAKRSKVVGWIDTVTSMGFLALMVLSIGLAIVTGGASLGATAGMVVAVGAAKGTSTIISGVTQYKGQEAQANMAGVQMKRDINQKDIQNTIKDLKTSLESLQKMAKLTRECLNNLYQETIAALGRGG